MNPPISACIIAFNEKANIRRCLESLKWLDEIIVVDSYSTDGTEKIAREYTDKVIQHSWPGYVNQKNYALQLAGNDWVISLDADESISGELKLKIIEEWAAKGCESYGGYFMPRCTFYLGRWIKHGGWYPDYKLRLFRKSLGSWGGVDPHDRVDIRGQTKKVSGDLLHYNYKNISDQIKTINHFSDITLKALIKDNAKFSLFSLMVRPIVKFIECYFIKHGFLDGLPGLVIAINSAFYVFIKYAKLWEKTERGKSN
ncbi:glycosyltransferase family 2 protein [Planctomycetota bacterium]